MNSPLRLHIHFDVTTDTVMLVHDEIPGCQGQWVDGLATTTRETLPIGGARALPEQISLGDQRESRQNETLATVAADQVHDPIRRTRHLVFDSGRDVAAGHLLTEPLELFLRCGAGRIPKHDDRELLAIESSHLVFRAVDIGHGRRWHHITDG